jgi:hypothetical protein
MRFQPLVAFPSAEAGPAKCEIVPDVPSRGYANNSGIGFPFPSLVT